jgi:hypothetical protein
MKCAVYSMQYAFSMFKYTKMHAPMRVRVFAHAHVVWLCCLRL